MICCRAGSYCSECDVEADGGEVDVVHFDVFALAGIEVAILLECVADGDVRGKILAAGEVDA